MLLLNDMKEYQSPSQVKTHSRCPKSWYYRYVDDKDPTKADMKVTNLGTWVHDAIENTLTETNAWPTENTKKLSNMIESEFHLLRDDLPDYLVKRGVSCCHTAAKYLVKQQPEIVSVEGKYRYSISDSPEDIKMSTRVDIMTSSEVWDWKTGSLYDNEDNVKDYIPHDEKVQGACYMASFLEETGKPPEVVKFVYLQDGRVRKIEPSDDNWNYMKKYARQLAKSKRNDDFPGEFGSHCFMCSYEAHCSVAPTGIGGVPFEHYRVI